MFYLILSYPIELNSCCCSLKVFAHILVVKKKLVLGVCGWLFGVGGSGLGVGGWDWGQRPQAGGPNRIQKPTAGSRKKGAKRHEFLVIYICLFQLRDSAQTNIKKHEAKWVGCKPNQIYITYRIRYVYPTEVCITYSFCASWSI